MRCGGKQKNQDKQPIICEQNILSCVISNQASILSNYVKGVKMLFNFIDKMLAMKLAFERARRKKRLKFCTKNSGIAFSITECYKAQCYF